jgi:hypothetical protein
MDLTKDQRTELNALSKELMGSESKWKKLLDRGYLETVTEEKEEEIPGENGAEPTKRKVRVPKLEKGMVVRTVQRHTYESLRNMLVAAKKQKDEYTAAVAKIKAEHDAARKAQEAAGGSAV